MKLKIRLKWRVKGWPRFDLISVAAFLTLPSRLSLESSILIFSDFFAIPLLFTFTITLHSQRFFALSSPRINRMFSVYLFIIRFLEWLHCCYSRFCVTIDCVLCRIDLYIEFLKIYSEGLVYMSFNQSSHYKKSRRSSSFNQQKTSCGLHSMPADSGRYAPPNVSNHR